MADAQAQADVEQADGTELGDDAGRPRREDGRLHHPGFWHDIIADKVLVLTFRNLQLKRIGGLQDKLMALSLARDPLAPGHSDRVDEALRVYAQAIRDYETLSLNAVPTIATDARFVGSMELAREEHRGSHQFGDRLAEFSSEFASRFAPLTEPFVTLLPGLFIYNSVRQLDLLERSLHSLAEQGSISPDELSLVDTMEGSCGRLGFRELEHQGKLRRAEKQALAQRILMGLFGGISLICPVLVMALYPSRNTSLITVSISTIVFAFLVATGISDGTGKDVLAATAAYTAVLVVFFGTSGG